MKTTLNAIDIVFQLLRNSPLNSAISGKVYRLKRPLGSTLEDVVINSLPISGEMTQRGTVNVNVYVPDLVVTFEGQTQPQPDYARLNALTTIAVAALADHYHDTYNLWIGAQTVLAETEISQHYVNLRIEFQNINTLQL